MLLIFVRIIVRLFVRLFFIALHNYENILVIKFFQFTMYSYHKPQQRGGVAKLAGILG